MVCGFCSINAVCNRNHCWGISLLLFFIYMMASKKRTNVQQDDPAILSYDHTCQICGYKWNWVVGTPKPEVQVRPDFIQKAAERLEEEERQRRRQQGLQ